LVGWLVARSFWWWHVVGITLDYKGMF